MIVDQYEALSKLIVYTSDQAHSSVEKAARLAVLKLRKLPTRPEDNYALRGEVFAKVITEDVNNGFIPCVV